MMRSTTWSLLGIVVIAAVACTGCATTITPPPRSGDDVPVFVTDYGRHSSILLPAPEGHYNEYAFGDFNWFALRHTRASDGLRALFFSAGSTLGRRQLNLSDNIDAVVRDTDAAAVIRFEAPRDKVNRLRDSLDGDFYARHDTVTYNPASDLWFVRARERYSGWHNCNHVTARWLRRLGCTVHGTAAFSKFRISPSH